MWVKTDSLVNEYIVSGKQAFFQGRTGWKSRSRWDGLWAPPFKLLSGLRFGFNLEPHNHWLDEASRFEFTGWMARHQFQPVEDIRAEIDVTAPEFIPAGVFVLKIANEGSEERTVRAFVDFTPEIRAPESEAIDHDYETWWDEKHLSVVTKRQGHPVHLFVHSPSFTGSYRLGDFDGELDSQGLPRTDGANHRQRVAGRCWLEILHGQLQPGSVHGLFLGCGSSSAFPSDVYESLGRLLGPNSDALAQKGDLYFRLISAHSTLRSGDPDLDRSFAGAKMNMEALKFSHPLLGLGVLSGLPWSTFFQGRDTCLMTLAMDTCGEFDGVKEILETLEARRARLPGFSMGFRYYSGEIPDKLDMGGSTVFKGADVTPLFILAVDNYLRWSGDRDFLQHIKHLVRDAAWTFKDHDEDRDGLADHGNFSTWMEEVDRGKSAVEVQAIWVQALEAASRILERSGEASRARTLKMESNRFRELIMKRFWNQDANWFYDTINSEGLPDTRITANPLVLLVSGLVSRKKAQTMLRRLENREFTTGWGVRCYSRSNDDYNGLERYRGNVWSLVTGWAAISEFNYGRPEEGYRYLETLGKLMEIQMYGAVPEALQGDRPVPSGSPLQGTASSMIIRGIFEGLLGLAPDALADKIVLEPTIPRRLERLKLEGIRLGDTLIDLEVTASHKVRIKSKKALRAVVALPVEHEDQASKIEVRGATMSGVRARKGLRGLRAVVSVDLRRDRTVTVLRN